MLRRDIEYVLTWDQQDSSWLARPLIRDHDHRIIQVGPGVTRLEPRLGQLAIVAEWSE